MSPRTVTAEPVVTFDQFLSIDTTGQFSLVASFPEDKTPDFKSFIGSSVFVINLEYHCSI